MQKTESLPNHDAARLIDKRIEELGDWRGATLARVRALIKEVDPEVVEEWKWRGVPVWSQGGIICTGETYKEVVKLTFAKGAALDDPSCLFNSSLEGNTRRAIDFRKDDTIDEAALKALVRAAIVLNTSKRPGRSGRAQRVPDKLVCGSPDWAVALAQRPACRYSGSPKKTWPVR
jgi:hypothetical protein